MFRFKITSSSTNVYVGNKVNCLPESESATGNYPEIKLNRTSSYWSQTSSNDSCSIAVNAIVECKRFSRMTGCDVFQIT